MEALNLSVSFSSEIPHVESNSFSYNNKNTSYQKYLIKNIAIELEIINNLKGATI